MSERKRSTAPIRVFLRDTVSGFTHTHETEGIWDVHDVFEDGIWREGNFSCDCNRTLFLTEWGTLGPGDLRNMAANEREQCGDGRIIVDRIERVDTGAVIYLEAAPDE